MGTDQRPIVVGVDGSEGSLQACRWAAREAQLTGRAIELAYSYIGPTIAVPMLPPPYDWLPEALREEGETLLARGEQVVRERAPEVAVTTRLEPGLPGQVLSELSEHAHLVVVGHRGHGRFGALLLGSVASAVLAHAQSPVVVVRGDDTAGGPVVVGVDGSDASLAALRFGFAAAQRHGVAVRPVHVCQPLREHSATGEDREPAEVEAGERDRLDAQLQPIRGEFPGVAVEPVVSTGHFAARLMELAVGATMLVVGSRGRGGFKGLLLGSVSQHVIRHAECPVAVIR